MNGRQRNATNAQIWGKENDSNYDGNCTSRDCLGGTYEIAGRWIFVGRSVHVSPIIGMSNLKYHAVCALSHSELHYYSGMFDVVC